MTTYNTLNPIPSTAPKDLYDNAQVIDEYANSELPSTLDRFGRQRLTLAGQNQQFQDALANTGFEFIGNYDDPGELTFTRRNQVMLKDGAYWGPAATLSLPYTTVNNWAIDQPKFVMRGDSGIRTDLASSSGSLGAALVNGAMRVVSSVAALRLLPKTGSPNVRVVNYVQGVRGGGGDFVYDGTDTTTVDNGFSTIVTGDGGRFKRQDLTGLTLQHAGGDPSGVANADTALDNMLAVVSDVLVENGQFRLNIGHTVFPGKNIHIGTNGSFFCTATGSIAIYGGFKADGFARIFYGPGAAIGVREVWPEWFGALGTGAGDDQPAFQAAHTCLQYASLNGSVGGRPTLWTQERLYQFNNTLTLQPTAKFNLRVCGAGSGASGGSRFQASTTFPNAALIAIDGPSIAGDQAADFIIEDFSVRANPSGIGACRAGIQVGTPLTPNRLEGWHCSVIRNVCVQNYPICWDLVHCRLINFQRCSGWNDTLAGGSTALMIRQAGNFTGDLRFDNCQFVSNVAAGCSSIRLNSNTGLSTGAPLNMIAGIKFTGCDIYQADRKLEIIAGSGSRVADIWFTQCQWDGNSNQDIYIASTGTGSVVDDINFVQCYVAGGNLNPALDQLLAFTATGGSVSGISVTGGNWQLAQGKTMNFQGVNGVVVDGVQIRDNNNQTGAAIEFGACNGITCTDNIEARVTGNFSKYMIQIGATCTRPIVTGNNGNGIPSTATINDLTGAISKVVANNL